MRIMRRQIVASVLGAWLLATAGIGVAQAQTVTLTANERVAGTITDAFWAPDKYTGRPTTPTIKIYEPANGRVVTVYADQQQARDMIVGGYACVGRQAVAVGNRYDAQEMSGVAIAVPDTSTPCTAALPSAVAQGS